MRFSLPWNKKRTLWGYGFIAFPVLYIIVIDFIAMILTFFYSFQKYDTLGTNLKFVGLKNYIYLFNNADFLQALQNTLVFGVVRVPVLIAISLVSALLLVSIKHFKSFFRTLYFMPFVTSAVAIAWVFKFMYLPNFGLFTSIFDFFNMPRINFLGDPKYAIWAIIAVSVWASIGFYTLLFVAGLEDIPQDYYEAAKVDGANAWQSFWKITMPLLNRTIVLNAVLCLISSLQTFTFVRLMSPGGFGGPLGSTQTLPILIYKEAFFSMKMGRAAAISVIFFIIVLILTLIQKRLTTREVD